MPVRVKAIPPGEFIRNHLRDAGGVDFIGSIHKAYKHYLKEAGLNCTASRQTMTKYIWLAKKIGLIVFDHAESPAYWDATVNPVRVTRTYVPEPRPRAPSPRHYYRLVLELDPRWSRLEASYRQSIGIPVGPAFPRVPYVPGAPPLVIQPEEEVVPPAIEIAPPPAAVVPPPPSAVPPTPPTLPTPPTPAAPARRGRRPRAKPPGPTPEEIVAPIEARIQTILQALDQLSRVPSLELVGAIDEELMNTGKAVVAASRRASPAVRERLGDTNKQLSAALHDIDLLTNAVRTYAKETPPARQARARTSVASAIRVIREDLTTIPKGG